MEIRVQALGLYETNCYLLKAKRGAILIDPGDDTAALDAMLGETDGKLGAIVFTHGHFDHMLGGAHVKKKTGAPVYVSRADEELLRSASLSMTPAYAVDRFEPLGADCYLEEGETELCGEACRVLLTPGHTKGSSCLCFPEDRLLFSGDTLFEHGYGRTDLYGGNMMQLVASLRRLFELPSELRVYPGHGADGVLGEIKRGYLR